MRETDSAMFEVKMRKFESVSEKTAVKFLVAYSAFVCKYFYLWHLDGVHLEKTYDIMFAKF